MLVRIYLIEFGEPVVLEGIKYQGIILLAQTTARAVVKFRTFCDENKIAVPLKNIREVRSDTYILVKDKSEYRWG